MISYSGIAGQCRGSALSLLTSGDQVPGQSEHARFGIRCGLQR
jgi:hypothetical protein